MALVGGCFVGTRPLSLTVIGWWLALGAVFGLFGILSINSNPIALQMLQKTGLSTTLYQVNGLVGCAVSAACSYGIFKGLPWSRVLYVVWGVLSLGFSVMFMPVLFAIVLGVVVLAVISFLLFRPAADQWFAARGFSLQRQG